MCEYTTVLPVLGAVFTKFTSKLNFLGRWNSVLSRCPQAELSADKRSKLFSQEKQRQIDLVKRVEKIKVQYCGVPENVTLYLNKDLSTPFNVAQRMWQSRILLFQKSVFKTRPSYIHYEPPMMSQGKTPGFFFHLLWEHFTWKGPLKVVN